MGADVIADSLRTLDELWTQFHSEASFLRAQLTAEAARLNVAGTHFGEDSKITRTRYQRYSSKDLLQLDVGGCRYKISRTTLLSEPGSLLYDMFSGDENVEKDTEGWVFIDRNGRLFEHVVTFLRQRDPALLPYDITDRLLLLKEAEFFGISSLVHALQSCPLTDCSKTGYLPPSVRSSLTLHTRKLADSGVSALSAATMSTYESPSNSVCSSPLPRDRMAIDDSMVDDMPQQICRTFSLPAQRPISERVLSDSPEKSHPGPFTTTPSIRSTGELAPLAEEGVSSSQEPPPLPPKLSPSTISIVHEAKMKRAESEISSSLESNKTDSFQSSSSSRRGTMTFVPPARTYFDISSPLRTLCSHGESTGRVKQPQALAVSGSCLYVADRGNRRVQILSLEGVPKGTINLGSLRPTAVAATPQGNVFVGCRGDHKQVDEVRVYSKDGTLISQFGQTGTGPGEFQHISAIFIDLITEKAIIADYMNDRIQVFTLDGTYVTEYLIGRGPSGISCTSRGYWVISLRDEQKLVYFDPEIGRILMSIEPPKHSPGRLVHPRGVFVDRHDNILVADGGTGNLQVFGPEGGYRTTIGMNMVVPWGMAGDKKGYVYVTDSEENKIHVF